MKIRTGRNDRTRTFGEIILVTERRATGNRFLDALPPVAAADIAHAADLVVIGIGARIAAGGDPVRRVLFPVSGAIAQVVEHPDGRAAELFAVGSEGVVGYETLLGEHDAIFTRTTSVPVCAFSIDAESLRVIADRTPELGTLTARYAVTTTRLAGIGAACERHHQITARLARWLLELHDHAGSAPLSLTHERAALSLDVRRASVTRAYAEIAATGAISIVRSRVTILDAAILESLACGCRQASAAAIEALYRVRLPWLDA